LWNDPVVRQSLVTQATEYAKKNPQILKKSNIEAAKKLVNDLPVPIGVARDTSRPMILSLIGWVLTAFGLSLGAPFWLSSLNTLLSLRVAGAKPGKAEPNKTDGQTNIKIPNGASSGAGISEFESAIPGDDLKDVQTVLGVPEEHATGVMNRITREYIFEFERKQGLVATGRLTQSLVERIMHV
jgi:hypothetical protein